MANARVVSATMLRDTLGSFVVVALAWVLAAENDLGRLRTVSVVLLALIVLAFDRPYLAGRGTAACSSIFAGDDETSPAAAYMTAACFMAILVATAEPSCRRGGARVAVSANDHAARNARAALPSRPKCSADRIPTRSECSGGTHRPTLGLDV